VAKRTKQILACEKLDERRRQQRKDGLPLEESPLSSLSMDASDGDDEGERGWGPLDYLPDVEEMAPGVSASSPTLPGGGGGDSALGSAIAHPMSEANTPELRALGKRVVSLSGLTEQAAAGATQLPPQGVEGAPEPDEGRSALVDAGAVPPPPPQSLQRRTAVPKRLQPRSR